MTILWVHATNEQRVEMAEEDARLVAASSSEIEERMRCLRKELDDLRDDLAELPNQEAEMICLAKRRRAQLDRGEEVTVSGWSELK